MRGNSILSVLGFGLVIVLLSSCSSTTDSPPTIVETRIVEEQRPAPIVPQVDQIQLRNVEWVIITPDNISEIFETLGPNRVLFAVTAGGYENLSLNLSDVRAMLQQQQQIIAIYEDSYER